MARMAENWKKILAGMLFIFAGHSASAEPVIVEFVAEENYRPYSYLEGGLPKGIYVRILTAAFAKMTDFDVSFRMLPWKRAIALIESGDALAIIPPYYKPEERPFMKPYSEPILLEKVAVFCRASHLQQDKSAWPDDYFGLRIANNRGYLSPGPVFFDAVEQGNIELNEVTSAVHGLKMLIQGRVDCYINDAQAIRWELARLQSRGEYDPVQVRIIQGAIASGEWGYVGFTDRDNGRFAYKDALVRQLNEVLRQMKADGQIDRIVERFFLNPAG
ncbi:substrate-binding periplasmic protein [Aestuariispira insulae]|uniref:Polar amino acid transport system substrate-binding protein n=1 Tax=Aestuariispira insulae TaxID=1461337 RepID=A0A3D9HXN2_9PROT|nr:transporter substrate-binding domain-containing protein [Aestuariispira insulae]RED54254.1 polar amino acid transport system substrate-binding protein [Aestuariispira insulae]